MITKPLGSLCHVIAGQSPDSSTYNTVGNGLPFFQGKADFQEMYPNVRVWCNSEKRKEALPGDILISVRAPVGAVNICNKQAIIGR
jgi:type I restriction enzyme S subunit